LRGESERPDKQKSQERKAGSSMPKGHKRKEDSEGGVNKNRPGTVKGGAKEKIVIVVGDDRDMKRKGLRERSYPFHLILARATQDIQKGKAQIVSSHNRSQAEGSKTGSGKASFHNRRKPQLRRQV